MKKIAISAILMAMTFFVLPSDGNNAVSAQKKWKGNKTVIVQNRDYRMGRNRGTWNRGTWNTGTWRKKDSHGYRNYGQYRRTQVGNRRFRMVSRPYWTNGVRRVRMVRTYY